MTRHLFVSYSRSDRAYVEELAAHLESAGVSLWYDHRLVAGQQFDEVIQERIAACAAVIVVLTPAAHRSRWVGRELAYAANLGREILPLSLEPCPPHILLSNLHQEDVTGGAMPGADFVERARQLCGAEQPPASPSTDDFSNPIRDGQSRFEQRFLGQENAARKILDILKRAALGLSGTAIRPRAALFLAGPGEPAKLEAANHLAELVYGDPAACVKFEMSDFSQEHSIERLLGAPPGYVGYEAGGHLTNLVRARPRTVLVFNEIEKAHGQVLDKLLQILEDGRLTDGQGLTSRFEQTVLVFISRLATIENIRDYFVDHMRRPELLNRIGDSVVFFELVDEGSAEAIFEVLLRGVVNQLATAHEIRLEFDPQVVTELRSLATSTEHGGRWIGNQIEQNLVNPLARYIFDQRCPRRTRLRVTAIKVDPYTGATLEIHASSY